MVKRCVATAIVAGWLSAGCELADPDAVSEQLAMLDFDGQRGWEVPDSAFVSRDFVIVVSTWGSPCVRPGTTKTIQSGMRVDITPYNLYPIGEIACESILEEKRHLARLRFDQTGVATIVFHGRRLTDSGSGSTFTSVVDTVAIVTNVRIVP